MRLISQPKKVLARSGTFFFLSALPGGQNERAARVYSFDMNILYFYCLIFSLLIKNCRAIVLCRNIQHRLAAERPWKAPSSTLAESLSR